MCECVCVWVWVGVCVGGCECVWVWVWVCVHTHVRACVHVRACMRVETHVGSEASLRSRHPSPCRWGRPGRTARSRAGSGSSRWRPTPGPCPPARRWAPRTGSGTSPLGRERRGPGRQYRRGDTTLHTHNTTLQYTVWRAHIQWLLWRTHPFVCKQELGIHLGGKDTEWLVMIQLLLLMLITIKKTMIGEH